MARVVAILFIVEIFLIFSCNPVLNYARNKYPGCIVEEVDDDTVLITCPGEEPFEKSYKRRN